MNRTVTTAPVPVDGPVPIEELVHLEAGELRALLAQRRITPMARVAVRTMHGTRKLDLKLEGGTVTGSVKDRTARALVAHHLRSGCLARGGTLVESTSGNLGVALATRARAHGFGFIAVVDPNATPENLERMERLGAHIELVEEPDESGGYLRNRLRRVAQLCGRSPSVVWADQYRSPWNPEAHETTTGPELLAQLPHPPHAAFIAVSTGGTLRGVARYLRRHSPATRIVAVDAVGSVVFGGAPAPRLLVGIGASRPPDFDLDGLVDEVVRVTDRQAFAACRALEADCGLGVGGSSGAVVVAMLGYLDRVSVPHRVVGLCPDSALGYRRTIWNDSWLAAHAIDPTSLTFPGLEQR